MEITEEENDYQNLKDFFWEANRAFMEKIYGKKLRFARRRYI